MSWWFSSSLRGRGVMLPSEERLVEIPFPPEVELPSVGSSPPCVGSKRDSEVGGGVISPEDEEEMGTGVPRSTTHRTHQETPKAKAGVMVTGVKQGSQCYDACVNPVKMKPINQPM